MNGCTKTGVLEHVHEALSSSELIASLASLQRGRASLLWGDAVRNLSDDEIARLVQLGNRAEDWSLVRAAGMFRPELVANNHFIGSVVLGDFSGEPPVVDGVPLPCGVYESTVGNCEIGSGASVHRVGLLSHTIVHPGAVVLSCSAITSPAATTYGCGQELVLAIESGGRQVRTYAEMTIRVAASLATARGEPDLLKSYEAAIDDYTRRVRADWTIIESGAVVRDSGRIVGSYIGKHARVTNARLLDESCLLSTQDEPVSVGDGAWVRRSILQWGASVDSMGLVDTAVLCEHSKVERQGMLTQSILGPNSSVGEGEVTASLVGPFVGFHHQALLIAAMWPEGKGNVGSGANIGSNHTGRAPDQEIWCGEGTFFGMATNVKFPTDLTSSPYSIIASGVTCPAQRVEFPFSLINLPASHIPDVSPAFNELFPGWVLANNMYALKRNEFKYHNHNKARRETFDVEVFRPQIIDMVLAARDRLAEAEDRNVYTQSDIRGLGKNYLTDKARLAGIAAYDFLIRHYALLGLKNRLVQQGLRPASPETPRQLSEPTDDTRWQHQRELLDGTGSDCDVAALLGELVEGSRKIAEDVQRSKTRDDTRGARIIKDYAQAHSPAKEDSVVQQVWNDHHVLEAEVQSLLDG